jgi:hypothetical protein
MQVNKEDLRKVKITKYDDGTGDYLKNGYFHRWAEFPYETEKGTVQNTLAIVELEDGSIRNYKSICLKFIDSF